jgi:hypothetical protein
MKMLRVGEQALDFAPGPRWPVGGIVLRAASHARRVIDMPVRQSCTTMAVLLLALGSPGIPTASAGTYVWGPIDGLGYYQPPPLYEPTTCFRSFGGTLTVHYDPNDLQYSSIDVETGNPAYGATGVSLTVSVSSDLVTISGQFGHGGVVSAAIIGDPGPLDSRGDPLSLDSLIGDKVYVCINPSYHGDILCFSGQSVPEPSSLLTLALGIGTVSVICAARTRRRGSIR